MFQVILDNFSGARQRVLMKKINVPLTTGEDLRDLFIKKLKEELPTIFTRREVEKLLGGAIAAGTLANLGKNGPKYVFVNRNAVYEKESFLEWLRTQMHMPKS